MSPTLQPLPEHRRNASSMYEYNNRRRFDNQSDIISPCSITLSTGKKNVSPMYDNPVGPGDYNISGTMGSRSNLSSNMRASPGFSFQQKTKLPYYKGWEIEYKGLASPAMNTYSPKHTMTN